ncbi:hypothetical protein CMQ_4644 [Grosmannia clavigera kw1407]|uniref:Uncharacterized protein n=1 Tax=Grosmannia clavigera (strain kw1407 / UAMH 11150) TaxID=655863 RepID=F0XUQ3_GROCL|nr:uncharacterized protein CMQ_4644 [Grosmannia clavigera kw1407]EFW98792.1 hypothetical protein CMQ_4644 [Grosmannia clavigera kw1407]
MRKSGAERQYPRSEDGDLLWTPGLEKKANGVGCGIRSNQGRRTIYDVGERTNHRPAAAVESDGGEKLPVVTTMGCAFINYYYRCYRC